MRPGWPDQYPYAACSLLTAAQVPPTSASEWRALLFGYARRVPGLVAGGAGPRPVRGFDLVMTSAVAPLLFGTDRVCRWPSCWQCVLGIPVGTGRHPGRPLTVYLMILRSPIAGFIRALGNAPAVDPGHCSSTRRWRDSEGSGFDWRAGPKPAAEIYDRYSCRRWRRQERDRRSLTSRGRHMPGGGRCSGCRAEVGPRPMPGVSRSQVCGYGAADGGAGDAPRSCGGGGGTGYSAAKFSTRSQTGFGRAGP